MHILAIDPGPEKSAYVLMDAATKSLLKFGHVENVTLLHEKFDAEHVVLEMVQSFGMPVGKEVFETCVWIGRFVQGFNKGYSFLYRTTVKGHICNSVKAKDANVRQALIDRFGPPGTKKQPGKLYGVSGDVWSALAIAVTYLDKRGME
jgi:hypothetical protein